jgi:putative membrane protein
MKQIRIVSLVSATAFLLLMPAAFAQPAGQGGPPGGGPAGGGPSTNPGQTAPSPGIGIPGGGGISGGDVAPIRVDDKKFAKDAALGGMTEVELGKLAVQKSSNDEVKQFGQKLVDEHTAANNQLKDVAGKENIEIPGSIDSKRQSRIDKLSKLSGEDFDKAFLKDQLKDHEAQVRDFSAEAQGGSDPNVKAFATKMLPALQQHLELAKNINKSEKKTK